MSSSAISVHAVLSDLFVGYRGSSANASNTERQAIVRRLLLEKSNCDLVQIKFSHPDFEPQRVMNLTSNLTEETVRNLIKTLLALDKKVAEEKSIAPDDVMRPGKFWAKYSERANTCLGMAIGDGAIRDFDNAKLWLTCTTSPINLQHDEAERNSIQHYEFNRNDLRSAANELTDLPSIVHGDALQIALPDCDVGVKDENIEEDFRSLCAVLLAYPICALSIPVFDKPKSGDRDPVFCSVELVWVTTPLPDGVFEVASAIALFVAKILPQIVNLTTSPLLHCWAYTQLNYSSAHPKKEHTLVNTLPLVQAFQKDTEWWTSVKALFEYQKDAPKAHPVGGAPVWSFHHTYPISVLTFQGILEDLGVSIQVDQGVPERIRLPSNPGMLFLYHFVEFISHLGKYEFCKLRTNSPLVEIVVEMPSSIRSFVGVYKTGHHEGKAVDSFRRVLYCPKLVQEDVRHILSEWQDAWSEICRWEEPNRVQNDNKHGNSHKSHLMPLIMEQFEDRCIKLSWFGEPGKKNY